MAANSALLDTPSVTATLLDSCKTELGECPIWDDRTQSILWIDIEGKKFFKRKWPDGDSTLTYDLPERPGCFCLCEDDRLIFAFERGPAYYSPEVGPSSLERITDWEKIPSKSSERDFATRMNDGRVDPMGRLVVGGYDDEAPTDGSRRSAIYRMDPATMKLEKLVPGIQCANSICFSPCGDTIYFTDSTIVPRRIFKVSGYKDICDGEELDIVHVNTPSHKVETLIEWTEEERLSGLYGLALPDGAVVDEGGNVWSAQFGLGRIVRYNSGGEIDFVIHVPSVSYITCLAFGGPDYRTVFITNGEPLLHRKLNKTMSEEKREMGGGLFAVTLPEGVGGGRPEARFRNTVES